MMIIDIVKVFLPAIISFSLGILLTPTITHYLYKHKMWKKKAGKTAYDGKEAVVFNELHKEKDTGTPRMGGIVIWLSVILTSLIIWSLSQVVPGESFVKLDFISRNQTWIPLFTLLIGAIVGFFDDYFEVIGKKGVSFKKRASIIVFLGLAIGYWFVEKLDVTTLGLPLGGDITVGWLLVPIIAFVMLVIYMGGVIDGVDGLAGGVFATMFAAYAGIAFYQQQIDLAAFSLTVVGGIMAFLWFNIPPARYYMSETGSMALTITLVVVAFMTDSLGGGYGLLVLPIIALPLLVTTASSALQILSKKYRNGKKIFRIAPLHHHFEAIGWPAYKVTMRYWVISVILSLLGVVLALLG
jgi:phospho-N-acetylmuramoyl-pentapeptide-transferase